MAPSTPSIRTTVIAGIAALMPAMVSAGQLDIYRDDNRLIVIALPAGASVQHLATALTESRTQIDERDLKIIDASVSPAKIPYTVRMTAEQTAQCRKELLLDSNETRAVFILIGKDGGEKAREFGTIDLEE